MILVSESEKAWRMKAFSANGTKITLLDNGVVWAKLTMKRSGKTPSEGGRRFSWPLHATLRFYFGVRGVAPQHEMSGRGGSPKGTDPNFEERRMSSEKSSVTGILWTFACFFVRVESKQWVFWRAFCDIWRAEKRDILMRKYWRIMGILKTNNYWVKIQSLTFMILKHRFNPFRAMFSHYFLFLKE